MTPEERVMLVEDSEAFLKCGGTITLKDWEVLTAIRKAALCVASDKLRAEFVAAVALSVRSVEQAAEIFSVADGGKLKSELRSIKDFEKVIASVNKVAQGVVSE